MTTPIPNTLSDGLGAADPSMVAALCRWDDDGGAAAEHPTDSRIDRPNRPASAEGCTAGVRSAAGAESDAAARRELSEFPHTIR